MVSGNLVMLGITMYLVCMYTHTYVCVEYPHKRVCVHNYAHKCRGQRRRAGVLLYRTLAYSLEIGCLVEIKSMMIVPEILLSLYFIISQLYTNIDILTYT